MPQNSSGEYYASTKPKTALSFGDYIAKVPYNPFQKAAPKFGNDAYDKPSDAWSFFGSSLGWDFGTTVESGYSAGASGSNLSRYPSRAAPANVDGSTSFSDQLFGYAGAALQGIGGQPEQATNPYLQNASYSQGSVGGIDVKIIAIVALVGAGIVYAYNN